VTSGFRVHLVPVVLRGAGAFACLAGRNVTVAGGWGAASETVTAAWFLPRFWASETRKKRLGDLMATEDGQLHGGIGVGSWISSRTDLYAEFGPKNKITIFPRQNEAFPVFPHRICTKRSGAIHNHRCQNGKKSVSIVVFEDWQGPGGPRHLWNRALWTGRGAVFVREGGEAR
jgi:hypothetical protein